eukprot:CAMPEP_0170648128 /NCGR_PEP_ID=MMETSP0224-20130122/44573_1 /TAXON_ID=285029 /ORGANISM="Togula jolla, Strain CCCM 725" /LENGTH=52 /DNA_ID=CAMNT_0010979641 /DNA_START=136 /DNA_END=291 /DNA_ORIENTATION=+
MGGAASNGRRLRAALVPLPSAARSEKSFGMKQLSTGSFKACATSRPSLVGRE